MSLSGFGKLARRASAYWMQQFHDPQTGDRDVSTNDGSLILQQSILDISAQKASQYLFPEIQACQIEEKINEEPEAVEIKIKHELEIEKDKDDYPSISSCSQCSKIKKHQRPRTSAGKKRFTNFENTLILQQINQGKNYTEIANSIPGATRSQIRHQILKKLKLCDRVNDLQVDGISKTVIKLEQLLEDENLDKNAKISEVKELISNLEGHLHQTKQLILQKYLYLFQS